MMSLFSMQLADLSTDGLLLVRDGRVAYANPAARTLLEAPLDGAELACLIQPVPAASPPGGEGALPSMLVRTCATGGQGRMLEVVAIDCETHEGAATAIRIRVPEPGLRIEIDRLKAESARLQELEAGIHAAGDAIYLIDPHTFKYLFVNDAAARLHGISREEVMAKGMFGLWPGEFTKEDRRRRYRGSA